MLIKNSLPLVAVCCSGADERETANAAQQSAATATGGRCFDGYKNLGNPKSRMDLTRRDAVAALAAVGGAGSLAAGYHQLQSADDTTQRQSPQTDLPGDDHVVETMVAVAEVVYPSEISGIDSFVSAFLDSRLDEDDHARGIAAAIAELDDHSESWHDASVADLDESTREQVLREFGTDAATADPSGSRDERVRYFVVNELLVALYASPTGAELVGLENPQGHPGGTTSYQQGPPATGEYG